MCIRDSYVADRSRSAANEVSSRGLMQATGTRIEDVDNTLHFWFQSKNVDWVLIRPDRFIAAAGKVGDAVPQLTIFCNNVLPTHI